MVMENEVKAENDEAIVGEPAPEASSAVSDATPAEPDSVVIQSSLDEPLSVKNEQDVVQEQREEEKRLNVDPEADAEMPLEEPEAEAPPPSSSAFDNLEEIAPVGDKSVLNVVKPLESEDGISQNVE